MTSYEDLVQVFTAALDETSTHYKQELDNLLTKLSSSSTSQGSGAVPTITDTETQSKQVIADNTAHMGEFLKE